MVGGPSSPGAIGSTSSSGGTRPAAMSSAATWVSTIWKVSLAVLPITAFSFSGSLSPGASTTIRCAPCWVMIGSLVPSASIRLRMISMERVTASLAAASAAWATKATTILWSGATERVTSRAPVSSRSPTEELNSLRAASTLVGSVIRTVTWSPTTARSEKSICSAASLVRMSSPRFVSRSLVRAGVSTSSSR